MNDWVYTKNEFSETIKKFEKSIGLLQKYVELDFLRVKNEIVSIKELSEIFNLTFYRAYYIEMQEEWSLDSKEGCRGFLAEMEKMVSIWKESIARRSGSKVERDFWDLYEWFQYVDVDSIYSLVLHNFKELPLEIQREYIRLPERYSFLNGKIDIEAQDFSLIKEYVVMMKSHIDDYKWLFEHLADYRSKVILNGIVNYWFRFDIDELHNMVETVYSDYYDLDITGLTDTNTVLVDLGAYTGDSVYEFINIYGRYKKIYAYELTPSTYQNLVNNTIDMENVVCVQKGVGRECALININDNENDAGNKISNAGNTQVEITTIDSDITEEIGIIKMDIEGAEKDALIGAQGHITKEKPQLLISAYHIPADIFDIPRIIHQFRDDYQFYLRFNGHGCLWPCDYVILAV